MTPFECCEIQETAFVLGVSEALVAIALRGWVRAFVQRYSILDRGRGTCSTSIFANKASNQLYIAGGIRESTITIVLILR